MDLEKDLKQDYVEEGDEQVFMSPGLDLRVMKDRDTEIGRYKTRTTVFE